MKTKTPNHMERNDWAQLAFTHYENFPVSPWFLPQSKQRALRCIYAFARIADDIADDGSSSQDERLSALHEMDKALDAIELNNSFQAPFYHELKDVIQSNNLSLVHFKNLLLAFKQDVQQDTYSSMESVLQYCRYSANPIGRLVLDLFSHEGYTQSSDAICTALQLINFAQDIESDWVDRARCYIPLDTLHTLELTPETLLCAQTEKQQKATWVLLHTAQELLNQGKDLMQARHFLLRIFMRCIIEGASLVLCRLVTRESIKDRPILSKTDRCRIFVYALFGFSQLPSLKKAIDSSNIKIEESSA